MKWLLSGSLILALGSWYLIHDTYSVSRIIDGDTLVVSRYGKEVSVRLLGIDSPERGSCYADEARQALADKVGESVTLKMDDSQNPYDAHGRVVAYVYNDEVLLNEVLLKEGYAREYTYVVPYLEQTSFQAAEHEAQVFGRGAWSACESWLTHQCGEGMLCSL